MAGTDLILTGKLSLGGTDVSNECTHFSLKVTRNDIVVPPTLGLPKTHAAGVRKWELTIGYLSDDSLTTNLFQILWTAVGTATKELTYSANLRDGSNAPTNPNWSGTIVVAGADLGGDVGTLSVGSITCTCTGDPVKAES